MDLPKQGTVLEIEQDSNRPVIYEDCLNNKILYQENALLNNTCT